MAVAFPLPSRPVFVVLVGVLSAASCGRAPTSTLPPPPGNYEATDRGPGTCSSLNDAGQVVGMDDVAGVAFLIPAGGGPRTGLGVRTGDLITFGLSINAGGQVAGFGQSATTRVATLWQSGTWKNVGMLPGGVFSLATALGDDGTLVGVSAVSGQPITNQPQSNPTTPPLTHAFLLPSGGGLVDLGVLGGNNSAAYAVAAGHVVAGIVETASGATHAFRYTGGTMQDLGTLGGTNSAAYGVNEHGDVVGVAETATGVGHAFLFTDSVMKDLGTLGGDGSDARSINDTGVIVGNSYAADGNVHPFVYSGGQMVDLLPKDATGTPFLMARAEAITSTGTIGGWGVAASNANGGAVRCLVWARN
jgi:probable HAF family extracellular repeat protein